MTIISLLRVVSIYVAIAFCNVACADADYPNTEWMGGQADKNADWYKQCVEVKDAHPPTSDLPSDELAASLQGCDATDLYYAAKSKAHPAKDDWQKARNCAFATNDDAVLMMLYANGFGVSRNLKLAMRYACSVGGAPAEVEGRVPHIAQLADEDQNRVFDLCDDITSGYMMGMCASISEQQKEKARNARLSQFTKNWTSPQKEMFARLRSALNDFAALRGPEETDLTGTARGAFVTETIADEMDHFVSDVGECEKGNLPQYSNEQVVELDSQLNQVYLEIMHSEPREGDTRLGFSTITKEGIKKTQRAWIKYRDAWVALGRAKWPSVSPGSWQAHLTKYRIEELKTLLDYAKE